MLEETKQEQNAEPKQEVVENQLDLVEVIVELKPLAVIKG